MTCSPSTSPRQFKRNALAFVNRPTAPKLISTKKPVPLWCIIRLRSSQAQVAPSNVDSSRLCIPSDSSIVAFVACSGLTRATARRIAQPTQGDLCHKASAPPLARQSCSSATGSIDIYPGESLPPTDYLRRRAAQQTQDTSCRGSGSTESLQLLGSFNGLAMQQNCVQGRHDSSKHER